jgi:hypothetical protein
MRIVNWFGNFFCPIRHAGDAFLMPIRITVSHSLLQIREILTGEFLAGVGSQTLIQADDSLSIGPPFVLFIDIFRTMK